MKFFEAFANMFRVPDLRKRLLFTLGLLAVYRLGSQVPTPGINTLRWADFFASQQGSIFGFFDLFAGGNIRRLTVFALGIMPYITASIILQLMTVVVPTLEKLQKEGELGRRKITQWTRYLTIILSVLQSFGIAQGLMSMQQGIVTSPGFGFVMLTILSLTTGSAFIMWLGEQISERGVGNGMSLKVNAGGVIPVIFASSILAFPQQLLMMSWVKNSNWLSNALKAIAHGEPLYYVLFVAGIIFFCFFYVSIIFNPNEAADNMRKYGGFIPGIRPGRNTADYMNNILTKITVVGGLYLSILCLIPDIMLSGIHLNHLPQ